MEEITFVITVADVNFETILTIHTKGVLPSIQRNKVSFNLFWCLCNLNMDVDMMGLFGSCQIWMVVRANF